MKKRFSITYCEKVDAKIASRRFAYTVAAGFVETAFSLSGETISPEELSSAKEAGLAVESLRLPVDGVNLLWEPNAVHPAAEDALPSDAPVWDERMWEALSGLYSSYFSFAAGVGVERVILTPTVGTALPPVSQTALSRFRALAECAKEKGVRLLVENDKSAPHFEAVVRVCCEDGFHGVSFSPARAWRYFGTSQIPPYASSHLMRLSLDDAKGDVFGYLPFDGDTDFRPFAKSLAPLHFRGTLAIMPDRGLAPYGEADHFAFATRAYDRLSALLRLMKNEEGVV